MEEHDDIAFQSCGRYCGTCLKLLLEFTRQSSASKMRRLSSCTFLLVFPHSRYILREYLLKRTTVCSLLYGKSYPSFTSTVCFAISIFFLPAYHLPVFSFHQISFRLLFEKSTLRIGSRFIFIKYFSSSPYVSVLNPFISFVPDFVLLLRAILLLLSFILLKLKFQLDIWIFRQGFFLQLGCVDF